MKIEANFLVDRRAGLKDEDFEPLISMKVGDLIESREDEYPHIAAYCQARRFVQMRRDVLQKRSNLRFRVIKGRGRFWILRTS